MVVLEGKWRQLQSELRSVFSTPFYTCQLYQTPPFPYFGLCMYSFMYSFFAAKQLPNSLNSLSSDARLSAVPDTSQVLKAWDSGAQGVPSYAMKDTYFSFHISYSTTLTSVDISTDIWHLTETIRENLRETSTACASYASYGLRAQFKCAALRSKLSPVSRFLLERRNLSSTWMNFAIPHHQYRPAG